MCVLKIATKFWYKCCQFNQLISSSNYSRTIYQKLLQPMLFRSCARKNSKDPSHPPKWALIHVNKGRRSEERESCCDRTAGSTRSCVRMSDKLVYLIYLKPDVVMNHLLNFCCFVEKFPWFFIHSQNWFDLNRFTEREKQPRSRNKEPSTKSTELG